MSSKWVVEFVNTAAEVFTHSGTLVATYDLGSLFTGKRGQGGDPKILFDAKSGDFFASYISKFVRPDGASEVDIALTKNPTGTWFVYRVHNEGILQDQPKLGISTNKVTIAWNDNGNSGPEEFKVIQKAAMVAHAGTAPGVIWGPDSSRLNLVPAIQLSPSGAAYAVFHNYGDNSIGVLTFTGIPGISTTNYSETDLSIASTSSPPPATQPASGSKASPTLDTGDDRLESAAWYRGTLWVAGNDNCRYSTDTAPRSCLRLIRVSTPSMSLVKDVDVSMIGGDVMYPAVTIDAQNNLWVSFSSSSASQFATADLVFAPGGNTSAIVGPTPFHTGTGVINYASCTTPPATRFGDYSGIAVDPAVQDLGVWAAAEYGVAGCAYGTEVGSFTP